MNNYLMLIGCLCFLAATILNMRPPGPPSPPSSASPAGKPAEPEWPTDMDRQWDHHNQIKPMVPDDEEWPPRYWVNQPGRNRATVII